MPMRKNLGGRPKNYDEDEEVSDEAVELSRALVKGLSSSLQQVLKFGGEQCLGPRQKQKLASEVMVSLFMQPVYREKFADWALKNPGEAAKLAATQIPKEISIEQNVHHNVVILPPAMTAEAWLAEQNADYIEADPIPWLKGEVVNE